MKRLVVGISGSSAPWLGIRLLEALRSKSDVEVHLVLSPHVESTLRFEAPEYSLEKLRSLAEYSYSWREIAAPIASGSFLTDGMVIMPCSMRTLASVAHGLSDNLLTRAADVTLKERRSLVLVPRETPLHQVHLQNMLTLTQMGAIILPPVMAFYHRPRTPLDLVDHTVGKVLDVLRIPHELFSRWQGTRQEGSPQS